MNKKIILGNEEKNKALRQLTGFLEKKAEVSFAYVFGSFVKGGPFEDVDLALYLEGGDGRESLRLEREAESVLRLPVEIVVLNEAPLSFAFRVLKEGKIIFARDDKARCDFEETTRVLYFDFLPLHRRYYKEAVLGEG